MPPVWSLGFVEDWHLQNLIWFIIYKTTVNCWMGGISIWTKKTKDAWLYNITRWRLLIGIIYLLRAPLLWLLEIVENCGLRCGRHSHYKCKYSKLEILDWFVTWKPWLKTSLFMTRHIFLGLGSTVLMHL